jgi:hypothetical protein
LSTEAGLGKAGLDEQFGGRPGTVGRIDQGLLMVGTVTDDQHDSERAD